MDIQLKHKWQTEEETAVMTLEEKQFAIILFNDDVNTFDHVIETLVKYCKHDPVQAEQCAHIVHFNGKCDVMHGTFENLEPICTTLLEKGLSAEIH
ncbi:MAG TPA: ATP-dependent Clp protease adaptor ClpS [Flavobacteriales bacterium]|nr:ATP-dependent Clp protease adaptor ClpS [Flavobacteriales bacterium]